jgi:hypothetical protein
MSTKRGIKIATIGKETIREAGHISMQDINNKIERYYNMLFK